MLKKRILATVVVKDGIVVQSSQFKSYLPVGAVSVTLDFLDKWGIDEIVLLDISATKTGKLTVLENLQYFVEKCFVPITYGGGLSAMFQVHDAFKKGADKVSFNAALSTDQSLISKTAAEFGQQSVVVSIDFVEEEQAMVYDYRSGEITGETLVAAINRAEALGVGEILINCVGKDGMYTGFAKKTVESLDNSNIPLIVVGGARRPEHFIEMLPLKQVSALGAGNMFHFVEHSVTKLKAQIESEYLRTDFQFTYKTHKFIDDQRIQKLPDEVLEGFLYEKLLDREI